MRRSWEEIQEILDNLPTPTRKPCNECPWLRSSVRGHIGPHDPDQWVEMAHADGPIACHKTIDYDGQDWSELRQCGGSAIFRANVYKTPRHPNVAKAEARDEETVFSWDDEFIEHHTVIHDAAGPCQPGYHRGMPDGKRCRCGKITR